MGKVVYLASYKGTHAGWKGLFNRLVRWVTKSDYSHSEVCVGNPLESAVLCVSSVGTEGGVRGKVMRLSPDEFDIDVMEGVTEADVLDFLNKHKGEPYDVIGCVRSILPFVGREHPTAWFCSEVAAEIKKLRDAWRYPPGTLAAVVRSKK